MSAPSTSTPPRSNVDARLQLRSSLRLALVYVAFAHVAFVAACLLFAANAGRWSHFYHPQVVAILHLVTVGWISGSILGMFYVVAPIALGVPLPARRLDAVACAGYMVGTTSMVVAAWYSRYGVLAGAAVLVLAAIARVGHRVIHGLRASDVAPGITLHVTLAFLNVLGAGALGMAMGIDRQWHVLNVPPMAQTWAHAHLAAVGWGLMLVMGLSYRLLPMMIPAAMPRGPGLKRSAWRIEAGTIALVIGHLFAVPWLLPSGALAIAAGVRAFVQQVRAIARRRLPPPAGRPADDPARRLAHACSSWLTLALCLGLLLTILPSSSATVAIAWVYGVAGLVGYLSQIVIGMGGRLFPLLAWFVGMTERGRPPACAVHELPRRALAYTVTYTWLLAVPTLAIGLAWRIRPVIVIGCIGLLVGTTANAVHVWMMWRRATALAVPAETPHRSITSHPERAY